MIWDDSGFLLSKNKYSENSIIAEVFTKNHGKVSGIIFGGTSKKIKNSGIETKYFIGEINELVNYKIENTSSLKLNFDSLRSNLSSQFDELRKISLETDKSFIGALNAQEKKQKKGIDDLEKKLTKKLEEKCGLYDEQFQIVFQAFENIKILLNQSAQKSKRKIGFHP